MWRCIFFYVLGFSCLSALTCTVMPAHGWQLVKWQRLRLYYLGHKAGCGIQLLAVFEWTTLSWTEGKQAAITRIAMLQWFPIAPAHEHLYA